MPLKPGDAAPPFRAQDQNGNERSSAEFAGMRYVIYFYPRDQTMVCTREACAFQAGIEGFRDMGVPVIGVSPDSVRSHKRFADKHGLEFALLADRERKVIDAFDAKGLLGRTTRVTYIVGPEGTVEAVHRAELSGQGHVDWAKAQLKALGPVPA